MPPIRSRLPWLLPLLAGAAVCALLARSPPRRAAKPDPGSASASAPAGAPEPQALEVPPAELNEAEALLQASLQPLGGHLLEPRLPELGSGWQDRFPPPSPETPPGAPPALPPAADFLIDRGGGAEAWFGGRGYRAGETLEGGRVLKDVTTSGIVVAGPAGDLELPLASGPAQEQP